MSIELFLRIVSIVDVTGLVNFLLAFVFFSRRSLEAKLIGVFFGFSILLYSVLHVIELHGKEINIPQSFCGIFQFLVTTLLYYVALNKKNGGRFLSVAIVFFLFGIVNVLFWQKLDINTYTSSISSFIVLVYCVVYWYRLLVELPVQELHRFPMFWYNSAFLIFSAGTLFLYLFTSYLQEVLHNNLLIYWSFHNILSIVQRIVIMIGLWQDLRNIKLGSSLPRVQ
jgi:hypothetical protein